MAVCKSVTIPGMTGHVRRNTHQLSTEVNALIQRAEVADRGAVADGMDIPAESHA
jgi:hypothetical protein